MKPALFYEELDDQKVQCHLCPHECILAEGKLGTCGVRRNRDGILYSEVYERPAAIHYDPIEKKPLYHFKPGSIILSIGTIGCNLKCSFCQNCDISQANVDTYRWSKNYSVSNIVEMASTQRENIGVSYTYNEPTIYYEYMFDIATRIKEKGLYNTMVSNGYINPDPLKKLLSVMDACNIDLKAFTNDFYKKHTKSSLQPVLESLKLIRKSQKHLEITNLVIPGLNDDRETFRKMINWITTELGENTVLHLSRYFPHHKLHVHSTPVSTLKEFYNTAREKLNFVYLGNVIASDGQNTYCPGCNNLLINRAGYHTSVTGLTREGKCNKCELKIQNIVL